MNIRFSGIALGILTPFLLGAVVKEVPATKACPRKAPTAESYTWNFPAEANEKFEKLEFHSRKLKEHANQLQAYARTNQVSWQSHSLHLNAVKSHVNRLGDILCRLQIVRHTLAPQQREVIDEIQPAIFTLGASAESAIRTLNENKGALWSTGYEDQISEISGEAREIGETVEFHTS